MTWTGQSFSVGQILTAAQMTNLQNDISAIPNKDAGAPQLADGYIDPIMFPALTSGNYQLGQTLEKAWITGLGTSYVKTQEFFMKRAGVVNSRMFVTNSNKSNSMNFRVYIDGVAEGTIRSVSSGNNATYEEDITVAAGEKIQMYVASGGTGGDNSGSCRFQIMVAESALLQSGGDPTL